MTRIIYFCIYVAIVVNLLNDCLALTDDEVTIMASNFLATRKNIHVLNGNMSYLDSGPVDAKYVVVLLHGNPTAAYLWRNIAPYLIQHGIRCVAPDLIGMGHSSKIPNSWYYVSDHVRYINEWFTLMKFPRKINLVVHDWGGPLGFNWAMNNKRRVQSLTFFEALVTYSENLDAMYDSMPIFKEFRSPAGEKLVLEENAFFDLFYELLPGVLSDKDKAEYLVPFLEPGESRRPMLTFPRDLPRKSEQRSCFVNKMTKKYSSWLAKTKRFPKHAILAYPGILTPAMADTVKDWANIEFTNVTGDRPMLHYFQEEAPRPLGMAIEKILVRVLKINTPL
ncbi:unnamed protein product [Owenia fusiformis]|uniref:AB hydrolase-1 domain-containing protein n=1 Tax=Owenia fusiformis TaxID=6347 RepID=A0A8S4N500_OWEFU|nr:unnamed protein product [Owenia fusiformis]